MDFGSGGAMQQVSTYREAVPPTSRPSSFHCFLLAAFSQRLHISVAKYHCLMS